MSTWSERRIEARLEQTLIDGAKARSGLAFKFAPISYVGLPDRLVLLPGGRIAFVEVKSPGEEPTPRQHFWLDKLRTLGFFATWLQTTEQAGQLLSDMGTEARR
mgnify:FL=1